MPADTGAPHGAFMTSASALERRRNFPNPIQKDSPAGRAEFEKRLELRWASEELEQEQELMGGWCLGSEEFRQELLEQMNERKGAEHYGAEIRESATGRAARLVKEELGRLGWRELDLTAHRKGSPEKLEIASRLRKETTMTLAWIAQRLQMGTKTHLSYLLYWQKRHHKTLRHWTGSRN